MPGLDQPCSRNPTAALPLVGRDPYVPCTPSGERGATGWGAAERSKDEAAQLVSCDNNTGRVPFCVVMLSPVVSGARKGSFACPPIRDKCKMNLLSRWRPS